LTIFKGTITHSPPTDSPLAWPRRPSVTVGIEWAVGRGGQPRPKTRLVKAAGGRVRLPLR